ncbi:MAG: hypothetical protein M3680_16505 [Myxococcota bacterium]|nr:hypothetical protein [Myxococcota bacterium]
MQRPTEGARRPALRHRWWSWLAAITPAPHTDLPWWSWLGAAPVPPACSLPAGRLPTSPPLHATTASGPDSRIKRELQGP